MSKVKGSITLDRADSLLACSRVQLKQISRVLAECQDDIREELDALDSVALFIAGLLRACLEAKAERAGGGSGAAARRLGLLLLGEPEPDGEPVQITIRIPVAGPPAPAKVLAELAAYAQDPMVALATDVDATVSIESGANQWLDLGGWCVKVLYVLHDLVLEDGSSAERDNERRCEALSKWLKEHGFSVRGMMWEPSTQPPPTAEPLPACFDDCAEPVGCDDCDMREEPSAKDEAARAELASRVPPMHWAEPGRPPLCGAEPGVKLSDAIMHCTSDAPWAVTCKGCREAMLETLRWYDEHPRDRPAVHSNDNAGSALIKLRVSLARLAQRAEAGTCIPGFPIESHDHNGSAVMVQGQDANFEMLNQVAASQAGGWHRLVNVLLDRLLPGLGKDYELACELWRRSENEPHVAKAQLLETAGNILEDVAHIDLESTTVADIVASALDNATSKD